MNPGEFIIVRFKTDQIETYIVIFHPGSPGSTTSDKSDIEQYTACTLKLRPVKLLFVIFGRLSYCFFTDVKSNLSVHAVYLNVVSCYRYNSTLSLWKIIERNSFDDMRSQAVLFCCETLNMSISYQKKHLKNLSTLYFPSGSCLIQRASRTFWISTP